jgi:hypothetical protein
MISPLEMRSPAPRGNADRAYRKSLTTSSDSTNQTSLPDFAATYIASRYRLPLHVAALVARLAELPGALS